MSSLGNKKPSVNYSGGNAMTTWEGFNDEIGAICIYERNWNRPSNNFASQTTVFDNADNSFNPSMSYNVDISGSASVAFTSAGTVYKAKYSNGNWIRTTIGAGRYPSITPHYNETLVYNKYNSAPYLLKHHYEAPAGGGIFIPKASKSTNMDSTVQLLASRRLNFSFGEAALSVDIDNARFGGRPLTWSDADRSDTLKAVSSGELSFKLTAFQKGDLPTGLADETLFSVYFVSDGEETLLRAFRLSDLQPETRGRRMGRQRHLLLSSRRARDGHFRIVAGARKPLEYTVLRPAAEIRPLAKATEVNGTFGLPAMYGLGQNYPNPFNPLTHIAFDLPLAGEVSLLVYDMTGRVVSTLVNGYKSAGSYDVTFDGTNLASGTYIYRLQAGPNFVETKKLLLVK